MITAESGFGTLGGSFSSCKTGTNTAAFSSGILLNTINYTGDCIGFFSATLDTTAKTITLTGLENGNYESGLFSITGIVGTTITGLTTVTSAGLFDPTVYVPGAEDVPTPILSFTGNSISISFTSIGSPSGQFAYSDDGSAVFAYTTGGPSAVPEPATWAMMIGGFGMVGGAMRYRRRKTTVSFA